MAPTFYVKKYYFKSAKVGVRVQPFYYRKLSSIVNSANEWQTIPPTCLRYKNLKNLNSVITQIFYNEKVLCRCVV